MRSRALPLTKMSEGAVCDGCFVRDRCTRDLPRTSDVLCSRAQNSRLSYHRQTYGHRVNVIEIWARRQGKGFCQREKGVNVPIADAQQLQCPRGTSRFATFGTTIFRIKPVLLGNNAQ